ncbi:MAG: hypothetical protein WC234_06435 [Endomicrobiaceae bacterium]
MKKIFINLLCFFIPSKKLRHKIRYNCFNNNKNFKKNNQNENILLKHAILSAHHHPKVFSEYKNKFNGRDVVLVATGPSLAKFKPINNAIYVGVNRAFQWGGHKLDFLFMQDYCGLDYIEDAKDNPAKKFYGIVRHDAFYRNGRSPMIPESIAIRHGAQRFYVNTSHDNNFSKDLDFAYDISVQTLSSYGSVVFSAMQFILYCNPSRIYLVGCDTSNSGYFNGGKNNMGLDRVMQGWLKMKEFIRIFYPEIEVISVNPVGLRGLFQDIDQ